MEFVSEDARFGAQRRPTTSSRSPKNVIRNDWMHQQWLKHAPARQKAV
jgi:hypothetical protein